MYDTRSCYKLSQIVICSIVTAMEGFHFANFDFIFRFIQPKLETIG